MEQQIKALNGSIFAAKRAYNENNQKIKESLVSNIDLKFGSIRELTPVGQGKERDLRRRLGDLEAELRAVKAEAQEDAPANIGALEQAKDVSRQLEVSSTLTAVPSI